MEQDKLNEIRLILLQRKQELQNVIIQNEHILRDQLAPDMDEVSRVDYNHPADAVAGDPDYEKEINLIRRERAELALVTSALSRMEQGTYGDCAECGAEIPLARLQAIPYTKYCISCKEARDAAARLEQKGRVAADPHDVTNLGL